MTKKKLTSFERANIKLDIFYQGAGIQADTAQFFRAFARGDARSKNTQIRQIISKWEKVRKDLRSLK